MERLLSLKEAAERLAISRSSLHRLVSSEHLPIVKLGRRVLVREADLSKWLAARVQVARGAK